MKKIIYKFLYIVSACLAVGFVINFGVDILKYNGYNTSAPLYVYALVRLFEFILPSIIVFVVAIFVKKK